MADRAAHATHAIAMVPITSATEHRAPRKEHLTRKNPSTEPQRKTGPAPSLSIIIPAHILAAWQAREA